jgi:hypothetical protein
MQPAKLIATILLGICFLPMMGCLRVKEADVPGTYSAKADLGTSALVLEKDHTLQQTVQLNSGEVKHISGRWELVSPAKNSRNYNITLVPCLDVRHDKQGVYAPWSFSSIDYIPFRGMEIAAEPDGGITYRRH